jgi:hypothetical protein
VLNFFSYPNIRSLPNRIKIREYSNPTKIDYKYLRTLKEIQKGGSHLGIQLLMAATMMTDKTTRSKRTPINLDII